MISEVNKVTDAMSIFGVVSTAISIGALWIWRRLKLGKWFLFGLLCSGCHAATVNFEWRPVTQLIESNGTTNDIPAAFLEDVRYSIYAGMLEVENQLQGTNASILVPAGEYEFTMTAQFGTNDWTRSEKSSAIIQRIYGRCVKVDGIKVEVSE